MANQWLRLWHDMPTDPKWRTIARHSKQPIHLVQAVYLHLLVDASRNVTRGHADVTVEDLASALDCDESQIQAVIDAMQGRVLDGDAISGWEKRQPKREDSGDADTGAKSSAQRKREQREREKQGAEQPVKPACHDASRGVTTDKDKDKDTEERETREASRSTSDRTKTLKTYLAECKEQGVKPIPDDHFIRSYMADAGISDDMAQVAWLRFREEHLSGTRKAKRYIDWPATFANSVKDRWYRLWTCQAEGEAQWTSEGNQARRAIEAANQNQQQEAA